MGKPANPLSEDVVSGDLDDILLSDTPTVNGDKVLGFNPEEIDQDTRTLDEKDQGKEFASFTMYKRVSDLSAEQRQIIKDVVSMELKPALEEALSHLGYRDAEESTGEDGVIDASEDYSADKAVENLETVLKDYVQLLYKAPESKGAAYQGPLANPALLEEFRYQYERWCPDDAIDMLFELYVQTQDQSIAYWIMLLGVENHDFDEKFLAALTASGKPYRAIRHKYDLYTEGGFSGLGGVDAPVIPFDPELNVDGGATVFRVMHTLQVYDEASGDYVDALPNYNWQTWFVMWTIGIEGGATVISASIPGINISASITPPQPWAGNDRMLNSATGYSNRYLGPEFFTSGLQYIQVGQSVSHATFGMEGSLEWSVLSLYDGSGRSLDIEQETSPGFVLTLKLYENFNYTGSASMGYSFETYNKLYNNSLSRSVLDYFYELSYPKEQLLLRPAGQQQWTIRTTIGFATGKSELDTEDKAAIASAVSLLMEYDTNYFLQGKTASTSIAITGSSSALQYGSASDDKNYQLAQDRAEAVKDIFLSYLENAMQDSLSGGTALGISDEIPAVVVQSSASDKKGDNSAFDRTAIIDIYIN